MYSKWWMWKKPSRWENKSREVHGSGEYNKWQSWDLEHLLK